MTHCNIFSEEDTLLINAQGLHGYSIKELAYSISKPLPVCLKNNKGFIGILIESLLGVITNNRISPDFCELNIELKTIPICSEGYPLENTFICYVPLFKNIGLTWESSYIYKKIRKILWIPIQGSRNSEFFNKKVGHAFIWSPSILEDNYLKKDWEEFMDYIILGKVNKIKSQYGSVLQVKKKSKRNVLTKYINEYGKISLTVPRAFYFRKKFTYSLLKNAFYKKFL
ncbi:MAG: DNA mismatch repair endonuclease MutH [Buchnera aphidicola (Schlechtendalia peitan)]